MQKINNKFSHKLSHFGPAIVALAAAGWSIGGVIRAQLQNPFGYPELFISPIPLVFWEHFFGLLFLLPFLYFNWDNIKNLSKKSWLLAALIGLLGGCLGTIFYVSGLSLLFFAPISIVVLMQQLQPFWGLLSAKIILKEEIDSKYLTPFILSILGVYLIVFKNPLNPIDLSTASQQATLLAAIFGILASACWGLSTSLGKLLTAEANFYTSTFMRFLFGFCFSALALGIIYITSNPLPELAPVWDTTGTFLNWNQTLIMATTIQLTGVGIMLIYYFGLKYTEARVATIAELAWPGTTLLYDLFTGKTFSPTQIIGILILITSITFVSRINRGHHEILAEETS